MDRAVLGRFRVVLADDEASVRNALRRVLERSGGFAIVGEARTGTEATELALSEQPDAVIMDLAMPGVDGLEALPAVRTAAPRAKVVILSGMARIRDLEEKAIARGASIVFDKGMHPRMVVARLQSLLTESAYRKD